MRKNRKEMELFLEGDVEFGEFKDRKFYFKNI
jgi:hypothetical protein